MKEAHRAHSDIAARNQPSNLYWLKGAWLEDMGTDAIAVWYVDDDQPAVNLSLLAVDQHTNSKLDAPIMCTSTRLRGSCLPIGMGGWLGDIGPNTDTADKVVQVL